MAAYKADRLYPTIASPPIMFGGDLRTALRCTLAVMTFLHNGVDAAFPGAVLPTGTDIVAGYVGAPELQGQPDTPHLWQVNEWNWYLDPHSERPDLYGGPGLRALPIYTHDYGGNPTVDARNAIDAMTDLGWHQHWFRLLAWDSEMLVDPAYEQGLAASLWDEEGWGLLPYGVFRTITQVPAPPHSPGVWAAALQPRRPYNLPTGLAGQQWQFGAEWDLNVFHPSVYNACGIGPRSLHP